MVIYLLSKYNADKFWLRIILKTLKILNNKAKRINFFNVKVIIQYKITTQNRRYLKVFVQLVSNEF